MNRLITYSLSINAIILMMFACGHGTILNPEKKETILKENELPEKIVEIFNKLSEKDIWFDYYAYNLDSNLVKMTDKALETGPWSNGHQFIIGDKKFHMKWNSNRECPPFILSNKKLYYRIVYYDRRKDEPKEFGMINLSEELKY